MRGALKISGVRVQSLQFIENMRFQNEPYGRYKYAPCQKEPVLYASVYALLTRHLYNDLSNLTKKQREEWTEYIKSFQSDDGWFRDPAVECELADSADWWGWRHMTYHTIMALTCLGAVTDKPFSIL
jgi:prenyltransferase beta subunit